MKKNNFYYLKKPLLFSVPIAVFLIIRELFEIGFSDINEIFIFIAKSLVIGILTTLIMGVINIFVKIDTLMKKQ